MIDVAEDDGGDALHLFIELLLGI